MRVPPLRVPRSIVQTKIYGPRRRGATTARPRLSDHLNSAPDARLTLVSARAGFGKTALLSAWLASAAQRDRLTTWLSLDQSDNDPTTFWIYVITAIQTVATAVSTGSLALIDAAQTPIEAVTATSLCELNALPNDLVLVLDDYHVLDDRQVQSNGLFRRSSPAASTERPRLNVVNLNAYGQPEPRGVPCD